MYRGLEFKADLSPRLRVEFVMFDDDVQAPLHQLLELVHPESISVFRLDQEVRTISSAHSHSEHGDKSKGRLDFCAPMAAGVTDRLWSVG
jgi:hypothetical protein